MENKEFLIQRTFDLARLGACTVSPNPKVGAIISIPNKIIGEGYHKQYGKEHAEVNAVSSVEKKNICFLKNSTISVSLEPCNFTGNTPPCSHLIVNNKISKVNISAIDKTSKVNFSGIQHLKDNGCQVEYGIKKNKGNFVARIRNTFTTKSRPYIILKYAQSKDGFMGLEGKQVWLSNKYTKRLVHKWRAELSAIMVGTNTLKTDDPELTTRLYPGTSPIRICIDKHNVIPASAKIKNKKAKTWIYTNNPVKDTSNVHWKKIAVVDDLIHQICNDLYQAKYSSIMVEGGSTLIQSFINMGMWDEARIITTAKFLKNGIPAPSLNGISIDKFPIHTDVIELIMSPKNVIYS